jgi:hypothetical protein
MPLEKQRIERIPLKRKYMNRVLYFPCEIGHREYPGRFLLASRMAAEKWTTVIGHKNSVDRLIPQLGPGIYITKDTCTPTSKRLENARQQGCIVGGIDEELLDVHSSFATNIDELTDGYHLTESYLEVADFYLASNRFSAIFAERKRAHGIHLLPSLRMVYAISMKPSAPLSDASPPRFLLPTHLGTINSLSIADLILISSRTRHVDIEALLNEQLCFLQIDKKNLITLVRILDACQQDGRQCSIRPHPAEHTGFYEIFSEKYSGIVEIDYGDLPLLNSTSKSMRIVSTSCSSLVEGALSGRKVVCLEADRECFLSSRTITQVGAEGFLADLNRESTVDIGELQRELFLENMDASAALDRWVYFLGSLSTGDKSPVISNVVFPRLSMDAYMRRRIGSFSSKLISSYFSPMFASGAAQLDIRGNEDVLIVSPK